MSSKENLHLDVRPLLAQGVDPFESIIAAKEKLQPGQSLVLTAPFEPLPLFGVFERAGYAAQSTRHEDGTWEIRFSPSAGNTETTRELDLRELEPPAPLQKSMEAIAQLGRGETLVLHTRFRPVHLFEELSNGNFDWECVEAGHQHWTTHLWRVSH